MKVIIQFLSITILVNNTLSQDNNGNGIEDNYESVFALMYGPILHYHENNPLFPTPVHEIYDESDFVQNDGWIPLPFDNHDPSSWQTYFEQVILPQNLQPTVYFNIITQTLGNNLFTLIQYWFYYPFNDASNIHEGDWEHIAVLLDGVNPASAIPVGALYQRHGVLDRYDWSYLERTDTHPHVYIGGWTKMRMNFMSWERPQDCMQTGGFMEITGACYANPGYHVAVGKQVKPVSIAGYNLMNFKITFDEEIIPNREISYNEYDLINVRGNNPNLWWKNYPDVYWGVNPDNNDDMINSTCDDVVTIVGNYFCEELEITYPVVYGTPKSLMYFYNNYPIATTSGSNVFTTISENINEWSHHIDYQLLLPSTVTVTLKSAYNGAELLSYDYQKEAGEHKFQWNFRNDQGLEQGSGGYYYEIETSPPALFDHINYFGKKEWSITFSNKFHETNLGGNLTINEQIPITSDETIYLWTGQHNVETNNLNFFDWYSTGVDYQHNNWNDILTDWKLIRAFNADDEDYQEAKYEIIENISFEPEANLEIMINDPWWTDGGGQQPGNVYIPANGQYKAFLNQNETLQL